MSEPPAVRDADRVLLVSLDNLGDLVFASGLVPPIRERYPDAHVTVWCKEYTRDIAPLIPGIDGVIAADPFWDRSPGRGKGDLFRFAGAVRQVRRGRFEVAVLAAAPWRTAAAVWATGIPVRIGLARRRAGRWLTHPLPADDRQRPVMAELSRLLAPLDIAPRPLRYRLDASPLQSRRDALVARLGTPPVAALHPFASKRDRCVSLAEWFRLAEMVAARGLVPLWIGSPRELGDMRATARAARREGAAWRYAMDVTDGSLADVAALLSLAALFVGHDSGPLHVAGAFGVPSVGIFAPGEPRRTFPQGVGPSRLLARPSPGGITAEDIMREVEALDGER